MALTITQRRAIGLALIRISPNDEHFRASDNVTDALTAADSGYYLSTWVRPLLEALLAGDTASLQAQVSGNYCTPKKKA